MASELLPMCLRKTPEIDHLQVKTSEMIAGLAQRALQQQRTQERRDYQEERPEVADGGVNVTNHQLLI